MLFLLIKISPRDIAHLAQGASLMFFAMLAVHLFGMRRKNDMLYLLFITMIAIAFLVGKDVLCQIGGSLSDGRMARLSLSLDLCYTPVWLALMLRIVTPAGVITPRRFVLMLLPFVAFVPLIFIFNSEALFTVSFVMAVVFTAVCVVLIFVSCARYNAFVKNNFSSTKHINVSWVRWVTLLFLAKSFWWCLYLVFDSWYIDALIYLADITSMAVVYFFSKRQKVLDDMPVPNIFSPKPSDNNVENTAVEPHTAFLMNRICACMEVDKLFLRPELSLNDMAEALKINRTYISRAINREAGTTFYRFVNQYRIRHFIEMMNVSDVGRYTIDSIAKQSGFNSMTTFYDLFKKEKGCTPREYIKR
ncbi:MAG: AraC family transcriptional regulator [Candidatus Symbiothrix sp.]|jgi:AraC-like DNA-binding protein|nr:AraC family transcriptional regulator [Candidatus Symbiothrix sp.]